MGGGGGRGSNRMPSAHYANCEHMLANSRKLPHNSSDCHFQSDDKKLLELCKVILCE